MKKRSTLKYVNLDDLKLDINNPRFGELYNGSKSEDDLIEYLLFEEAAEDIAKAIVKKDEFYEDKALWVIKDSDGKYIVRDGNRRCAAVKALQMPGKYKITEPKTDIIELPVYEYFDEEVLKLRIGEEHAASLFRSWERIAKSLQILDLFENGKNDIMNSLDSKPGDFIKLGSFYKEAVKYGGDELRKQIRRGRGKTGGKTIIFERLFKHAKLCGYKFKNSPLFKIEITDQEKFKFYIKALVKYISTNPDIKTSDIDNNQFSIKQLKDYGFDCYKTTSSDFTSSNNEVPLINNDSAGTFLSVDPFTSRAPSKSELDSNLAPVPLNSTSFVNSGNASTSAPFEEALANNPISNAGSKRGSTKKTPDIYRKKLPPGLKSRIVEYFKIPSGEMPNAKIAMGRVLFECVMKFVIEETKYNGKTIMSKSGYFGAVYSETKYTDFRKMRHKFIELITSNKDRNAMTSFDLDHLHQVVHNYKVSGVSTVGDEVSANLIGLIEFMLQEEADLLYSLDLKKL